MATTKDIFGWVKKELDKYESPTFEPVDFDYFLNLTIDEYISNQIVEGDIVEKGIDDLDAFIKYGKSLTQHLTNKNLFELPTDPEYRHVWTVKVTAKWTSDFGKYKKDDVITLYPKRRRSERTGFQEDNAWQRPSFRYPLYRRVDTSDETAHLEILLGDYLEPVTCVIDYIMQMPDYSYNATPPNDEVPVPTYVAREIAKLTARKFLENIESPRYSSQLQEKQLRNE